jgi:hypothetical protein
LTHLGSSVAVWRIDSRPLVEYVQSSMDSIILKRVSSSLRFGMTGWLQNLPALSQRYYYFRSFSCCLNNPRGPDVPKLEGKDRVVNLSTWQSVSHLGPGILQRLSRNTKVGSINAMDVTIGLHIVAEAGEKRCLKPLPPDFSKTFPTHCMVY